MRSAAAYAIARPISSSSAPARNASSSAAATTSGSSSRSCQPSAPTSANSPRRALTFGERAVERFDRALRERGVVVRVAPLAELLGPGRRRGLAHERGQDLARRVLAEVLDRFERLVREVDGVTAVDEHVVGDGREHHRLHVGEPARARRARSRACARPRRRNGCRRSAGTSCRAGRPERPASRARRPRSVARDCACRARRT